MYWLARLSAAFAIFASLLFPLSTSAFFSFGGRVAVVVPCLSPSGPAVWFNIAPLGAFPLFYIWAPGTVGMPPNHSFQSIIGTYDIPYACKVGPAVFSGFRLRSDGVSPIF